MVMRWWHGGCAVCLLVLVLLGVVVMVGVVFCSDVVYAAEKCWYMHYVSYLAQHSPNVLQRYNSSTPYSKHYKLSSLIYYSTWSNKMNSDCSTRVINTPWQREPKQIKLDKSNPFPFYTPETSP